MASQSVQQINKIALVTLFVVVLVGGLALRFVYTHLQFPRIGNFLGLIAVVALLVHELVKTYGDAIVSDPEHWSRRHARNFAPILFALFIPLTIVAAYYQLVSEADSTVKNSENPDEFIKQASSWFGTEHQINPRGLRDHLKANATKQEAISKKIDQLWFFELLIVNCGVSPECPCPNPYKQVEFSKDWNLNAGISGAAGISVVSDKVNLCWKGSKHSRTSTP